LNENHHIKKEAPSINIGLVRPDKKMAAKSITYQAHVPEELAPFVEACKNCQKGTTITLKSYRNIGRMPCLVDILAAYRKTGAKILCATNHLEQADDIIQETNKCSGNVDGIAISTGPVTLEKVPRGLGSYDVVAVLDGALDTSSVSENARVFLLDMF
jgi:hypothetical protein